MKKKLFILLALLVAMTLVFVACKDDPTPPDDTTVADQPTEEPTQGEEDPTQAPDTDPETPEPGTDEPDEPTTPAPDTDEPETPAPDTDEPETPEPETADPMEPVNVFDAEDIQTVTGGDPNNMTQDCLTLEDGFVHIVPIGPDPYYYPFAGVDGARYVAIRYRTDATGADIQMYIGSTGGGPSDDSTMLRQPVVADSEWHVAIFDTQSLIDAGKYDGKYVSYFRFDALEAGYKLNENGETYKNEDGTWARYSLPEGCSIDVAYIGFFHSEEAAKKYDFDLNKAPMWDADKSVILHQNFDQFFLGNGTPDDATINNLNLYHAVNIPNWDKVATLPDFSVETLTYWGWMALTAETVGTFGYQIDMDDPIYDESFYFTPEQPVVDAAVNMGGKTGTRYLIRINIAGLDGTHTVRVLYKDAEGNEVCMNEITVNLPKLPDDITDSFVSDVSSNEVGTTMDASDLANFFVTELPLPGSGVEANGEGKLYHLTSINDMYADVNGRYFIKANVIDSNGAGWMFARGYKVVNSDEIIEKFDPAGGFYKINNYYETDNAGAMGGAGIYARLQGGKLYLMVKYYNPETVTRVGNKLYFIEAAGSELTLADNGSKVSVLVDGVTYATIELSGSIAYGDINEVQPAGEFAEKAVVTLKDGTTETIENTLIAATCQCQVGFVARSGSFKFDSVAVGSYSAIEVPALEIVTPEEPEPVDPDAPVLILTPEFINGQALSTGGQTITQHIATSEIKTEDEITFVRLTTSDGDPYVALVNIGSMLELPPYMAFSYRTNGSLDAHVFIGSGAGWNGQGDVTSVAWNEDQQWNHTILDLNNAGLTSIQNGLINYCRFDFFTGKGAEGDYMDVEYVAFFNSAEAAQKYYNDLHGIVEAPKMPAEFSLSLNQVNLGKTLYFSGAMSGYYFAASENPADAVKVYSEAVEGGYRMYFMDGETKTYLDIVYRDKNKANVVLTTDPVGVYVWNAEANTWTVTIPEAEATFYLGTYNSYNTISASSVYYITGDNAANVGVSQFVAVWGDMPHVHSYDNVTVIAPTCTEAGYTKHECSCGEYTTSDEVPATGHSYVMGVCSVCGAVDPDFVPAYKNETITLAERAGGGPFGATKTFGQRYNIGVNILKAITVESMATYDDGDVNTWSLKVWQWNTDYATTVAAEPLFVKLGENHKNNSHFSVLIEGVEIKGDFYYEVEYLTGSKQFTGWAAQGTVIEGLETYAGGQLKDNHYASSIIIGVPYDPNAPVADITNKFESNVGSNAEGTDIRDSDLKNYFTIVYGAAEPHKVANGMYQFGGINEMFAKADGLYAFSANIQGAVIMADTLFVRGYHAVNFPENPAMLVNNYYEDDGDGSTGGAGIYVTIKGDVLYIVVKAYNGDKSKGIQNYIYQLPANGGTNLTIADDGKVVYVILEGKLMATVALSGETTYDRITLPLDPGATFAKTAVVTLVDGTVATIENTLVASTYASQFGFAARAGQINFLSTSVKGLSEIEIPDFPHVHTEETIPGKDATCTEPGLTEGVKCPVCGEILVPQEEIPAAGHNFVDGSCGICGEKDPDYVEPDAPAADNATIDFTTTDQRTEYSTTVQVWKDGNFVLTNNKAASTSNIGDYFKPARFYANTELIFAFPGMTKIVIDANSGKPVDGWVNCINDSNATVTKDGNIVTIVFTVPVDSFTITIGAQVRANAISVYAEKAPEEPAANEIQVSTTDTYSWIDAVEFTATVSGTYTFDLPAGLGAWDVVKYDNFSGDPYVDFYANENGASFSVDIAAGDTYAFYVGATTKGDWTITWSVEEKEIGGGDEPGTDDPEIPVDPADDISGTYSTGGDDTLVIDMAAGTMVYTFTGTGGAINTIEYGISIADGIVTLSNANGPIVGPMAVYMGVLELDENGKPSVFHYNGYTYDVTAAGAVEPDPEQPEVGDLILVVGNNNITITDEIIAEGGIVYQLVVTEEGTYTVKGDFFVQFQDAMGMTYGNGSYLTAGTYDVRLGTMLISVAGNYNAEVEFTAPEGGDVVDPEPSGNPVIESLPFTYEITTDGQDTFDVYYDFTAAEDVTLIISRPEGALVSLSGNSNDWDTDEDGNYVLFVPAGETVCLNFWTMSPTTVGSFTVSAKADEPEIVEHTVTFVANGETVKTETVVDGAAATAPEAPAVDGKWFAGWDVDFSAVSGDITVTAIYKDNGVFKHASNDELIVLGGKVPYSPFAPGAYDSWNNKLVLEVGSFTDIKDWGWAAFNSETFQYGYIINGGEPIWADAYTVTAGQDIWNAINGLATNCSRFSGMLNAAALQMGDNNVKFCVKLDGGVVSVIREYTVTIIEAAPETEGNYDVPMDTWTVSGHKSGLTTSAADPAVGAAGYTQAAMLHQGSVGVGQVDLSKYSKVIVYYGIDNGAGTQATYNANGTNRIMVTTADNHMSTQPGGTVLASQTYTLCGWAVKSVEIDLTGVDYEGPVYITWDTLAGTFMLIGSIEFVV